MVVVQQRHSKSRRCQQRYMYNKLSLITANRIITAINSLHQPKLYQPISYIAKQQTIFNQLYNNKIYKNNFFTNSTNSIVTKRQRQCMKYILSCAERYIESCRSVEQSTLCDGSYDMSKYNELHISDYIKTTLARPVVSDKVSLPNTNNKGVRMLDLLPDELIKLYAEFNPLLFKTSEQLNNTPAIKGKPVCLGSTTEYIKLIKRMYQANMIAFHSPSTVKCVNGMFCVDKGTKLRLIIDARYANRLFATPRKVQLPNPSHMASLHVDSNSTLYTYKLDLSNYYHSLILPEWIQQYMGLPIINMNDVIPNYSTEPVYMHPCCATMPMGWSHAVYLAQQIHENILYKSNCLNIVDNILHINRPTIQSTQVVHAIYIDDHIGFSTNLQIAQRQYTNVLHTITQSGLTCQENKCEPPSAEPKTALGIYINKNTLQPPTDKLFKLLSHTVSILQRDAVTPHELSVLVGHWNWFCLLQRPAMQILNSVYYYTSKHHTNLRVRIKQYQVHSLWPSIRTELLQLIGIAPLLVTNLSDSISNTLYATDASMTGNGVVRLQNIHDSIQYALWKQSRNKLHNYQSNAHLAMLQQLKQCQWTTIVSKPWRYRAHINVLELHSILTLLRHIISHPNFDRHKKQLLLTDSTVAYYNVYKGRTSAKHLQRIMSKLSALLLGSGIKLIPLWVETALNPADAASRLQLNE